ncbi:MAG: hypothetical protein ACREQN_05510 [Candidatus Binataceae bacterium]
MPRRRNSNSATSAFRQVQQQARALLINLHKEIRIKEAEVKRLKEEETSLIQLTGRSASIASGVSEAGSSASRGRINWRAVLDQLPKQFKASNIRSLRGLKGKRPSEIFAAITRWIDAGMVKRKSRGLYERVA